MFARKLMDEIMELYIISEMRQTAKIKVDENTTVSKIYKLLKLPENILLMDQGNILQKARKLKHCGVRNGSRIVCVSSQNTSNNINLEFKQLEQRQKLCSSFLHEKARLSDLAQISIDNNPKKFRRFIQIFEKMSQDYALPNNTTISHPVSPCSPSSEPLPVSWE